MIHFGFVLRNPFSQLHRLVWERTYSTSKNTCAELCVYRTNGIIGMGLYITGFKQDHRGFGFDLDFLGWNFDFTLYDNRHSVDYK